MHMFLLNWESGVCWGPSQEDMFPIRNSLYWEMADSGPGAAGWESGVNDKVNKASYDPSHAKCLMGGVWQPSQVIS